MSVLYRKCLWFLVQDTCCLTGHFHFFVDAIKNVFIQKENDCESYDHPFVKELLDYIDVALTYILSGENAREFISSSKSNFRKKIRGRLRAKEHNFKKEHMLHTCCGFCKKNCIFHCHC